MHQQLRHQYLETLGISSWLPRATLPGAGNSAQWVSEFVYDPDFVVNDLVNTVAEAIDQVASSAVDGQKSSAQQAVSLAASLVETGSAAQSEVTLNSQPQATAETVAAVTAESEKHASLTKEVVAEADLSVPAVTSQRNPAMPRHTSISTSSNKPPPIMRLMFLQYSDVLVVDSLPSQSRGNIASDQYQQLVANILRAMGLDSKRLDAGAAPYILNWPTLAGDNIDQGWDQAVSAVQHKLAKIFQQHTPSLVLMLGEVAAQMLMSREDDFDAMRGIVFSLRTETKAITSYSLTQMLNVPGCKREVWQDLQKVLPVK